MGSSKDSRDESNNVVEGASKGNNTAGEFWKGGNIGSYSNILPKGKSG